MAQIVEISPRHEAIILYILANPELKLVDVARKFGVTQPWLSTLLRSDLMRSRLRELQGVIADELVLSTKDHLEGLAKAAMERLTTRIESGAIDNEDLIDAAEMAVKHVMGGGQPKGSPIQVNVNTYPPVDPQVLAAARERMLKHATIEIEQEVLPEPSRDQ